MKKILFFFDSTNASPNGDPNTNAPRYDEVNQKAEISDLKIKALIRSGLHNAGNEILYNKSYLINTEKAEQNTSGIAWKFDRYCNAKGYDINKIDKFKTTINDFIDTRLFGTVLTVKNDNINIQGPVQFNNITQSVNNVEYGTNFIENFTLTSHLPSEAKNKSGSMGTRPYIKYALFCAEATINPNIAKMNNLTDDDINAMLGAFWNELSTYKTTSKNYSPIGFIIINTETLELKNGNIVSLNPLKNNEKLFHLNNNDLSDIYSIDDVEFDFTELSEMTKNKKTKIKSLQIMTDSDKFKKLFKGELKVQYEYLDPNETYRNYTIKQ